MDLGKSKRGIAGVLAAVLLFGMLFTAGFAYMTWQAVANQNENTANVSRQNTIEQGNLERMSLAPLVTGTGPYSVTIYAENSGGVPITIVGAYASNGGAVISPPGITSFSAPGVDLAIGQNISVDTISGIPISISSGTVSLITSRGNTFSALFCVPSVCPTQFTTTISTTSSSTSTTTTLPGLAGSNALVVQMVATPPISFGCHNGCVLDNVTVSNFTPNQMTNVELSPYPPSVQECGFTPGCTAALTSCTLSGSTCVPPAACNGPYYDHVLTSNTIGPYSGSGNAPEIYYQCYYNVSTGGVGGYASFSAQATAAQVFTGPPVTNIPVASAIAISNTVQIGGSTNVLGQGPFTANFFVFKYSSCTNAPSTGHPCTTTPPTMPPAYFHRLGNASIISGSGNQYVALYFQITNDYNTIIPILKYSFVQFESALNLGESDIYIAGGPANQTEGSTIYPNYCESGGGPPACSSNDNPVFNAYTATASSCAETKDSQGVYEPPATTCINVSPGQSAILTFAACGPGYSGWEWGGPDGAQSGTCSPTATYSLNIGSHGAPTALILVVCYLLNNVVYTEDIAFQSMAITP